VQSEKVVPIAVERPHIDLAREQGLDHAPWRDERSDPRDLTVRIGPTVPI
jgi:hypothetical protein